MNRLSQVIWTIVFVTCAGLVHAQSTTTYDKCLIALEEGDIDQAQRLAAVIESKKNLTEENVIKGTRCLEEAWGETYWYHPDYKFWVKGEKAITLKQAAATREVREKLMRKQRCLLAKSSAIDDLRKIILDELDTENKQLIGERTLAACIELNDADPTAAILNPICREAFTQKLHPDLENQYLLGQFQKLDSEDVMVSLDLIETQLELAKLDNKKAPSTTDGKSISERAFQTCE